MSDPVPQTALTCIWWWQKEGDVGRLLHCWYQEVLKTASTSSQPFKTFLVLCPWLPGCRCETSGGLQTIVTSYYHAALNVPVPEWQVNTTWTATDLHRFDNVLMSIWVLFQVLCCRLASMFGGRRICLGICLGVCVPQDVMG
jgi:hypothetical protein